MDDAVRDDPRLHIQLFGEFRVWTPAHPVTISRWRRKTVRLIKLLALSPKHRLHREQVLDLLWPELPAKAALNNLHGVIHNARHALAFSPAWLRFDGDCLLLGDGVWIDVDAFLAAAASARSTGEVSDYQQALALYGGDLLPDDRYEDWVSAHHEALKSLYLDLLMELAQLHEDSGNHRAALAAFDKAWRSEPALEAAHRGVMRLHLLLGQHRRAHSQFEKLREVLQQELAAEPSRESQALHEKILAAIASQAHEAKPPALAPSALAPSTIARSTPAPALPRTLTPALTRFVGREGELAELERLLSTTRLLTVSGAPGCGKSRLALELALRRRHAYRDGLFIVDVSLCHEPLCITSLILEALGLQGDGFEALSSYLHDKQLLLVLDNCGHLAQASAQLVNSLLRHCPELHVLSASREALYLPSEQRWQLAPLPLPNGEGLSVDALLRCEAVALFLDHARLHHADFTLTPERAEAVVRICRQLEGLPLALELAAAKLSVLPVAQLAARLESSLGLLSYKSPVIPSRHWSFEGAVDMSYALLSEEERGLFACLSVFSGSFALEAVEALTTDPEVLERLAGLVSRSLVVVERERSPFRYRLLKPIRHYALGKLGAEEVRRLRDRHLEVYLALAEAAHQAGQPLGEAERQDLHAALAWALERGEHEKGLSLALALAPTWQRQNRQREGRYWLEAFLQAADLQPQLEEQAQHGLAALAADVRR